MYHTPAKSQRLHVKHKNPDAATPVGVFQFQRRLYFETTCVPEFGRLYQ